MQGAATRAGLGLLLLWSASVAYACGDEAGATQLVKCDAARNPADQAALAGTVAALDSFSIDLYAILAREEEGNLVFSPYSAAIALGMTRAGAAGETLAEMDEVLHAREAPDLDAGFNAIEIALAERPGEYSWGDKKVNLELSTANQLFGQRDFAFHDAFLATLAADYGAGMRLVDYQSATEEAREAINAWVAEQTRDRIPELIPEGVLTQDTRLVLTNAIYLKAPWRHRFAADLTAAGAFTTLAGATVEAQMMRTSMPIGYASGPGYEAVELPYVDGSLAMLVIVPDAGNFEVFEGSLSSNTPTDIATNLQGALVTLTLPKFEFRTQAGLKDALIELGMPIAFDPDAADFSGMSPGGQDMYIQDVLQEAFIAVDEEGTEAAAATAVVAGATSAPQPVTLVVDRPFLFFLRDNDTGATLFMGRVVDPTS